MVDYVCSVDGVPVAYNRRGEWVHTEEFDAHYPEHAVVAIDPRSLREPEHVKSVGERQAEATERIAVAVEDILAWLRQRD